MIKFRKTQARDEQRSCGRFIFKARSPTQTMNALDEYLRSLGDEPVRWLAREVRSWGNEFSYSELAAAIEAGNLDDLINWQERYADIVNEKLAPLWAAAIAEASKQATRGMTVLSDSNDYVRGWINTHGGELITRLSDESRLAVMNVILRGQGLRMAPRDVAKEVRPLIGLNDRQAAANQKYKQEILQRYLERGMSESKAAERADKAALKYAGKQHRYRAETIVLTENAYAYNRGAHMGVSQSIADGYMGRCAMIWTTAGTNRVCSRCLALKDTVVGYTDELGVLLPPLHPRCRCAIMYDEVGTPRVMQPKPKPKEEFKPTTDYFSFDNASDVRYIFGTPKSKSSFFATWNKSLTEAERNAVIDYTDVSYTSMNYWLRNDKGVLPPNPPERLVSIRKDVLNCESALNKSELPYNILVHRQVDSLMLDVYQKALDEAEGIFIDHGFTSTTLIKNSFKLIEDNINIEIVVPAGEGVGMWLKPISINPRENEFLLNRGTKFKILEIDRSGNKPLIKLEVIGREPIELSEVQKLSKAKETSNEKVIDTRADKFTWKPADIEAQDEQGNWIRGDEFLNRK